MGRLAVTIYMLYFGFFWIYGDWSLSAVFQNWEGHGVSVVLVGSSHLVGSGPAAVRLRPLHLLTFVLFCLLECH